MAVVFLTDIGNSVWTKLPLSFARNLDAKADFLASLIP
jgi:hypothetical protein